MIFWTCVGAFSVAFFFSLLATPVTITLSGRLNMLDVPGRHKSHRRPVPLLGGCAIFTAIALPTLLAAAVAVWWHVGGPPGWVPDELTVHLPGAARKAPLAGGIVLAMLGLHIVGLIDDRRDLAAGTKLLAQTIAAAFVVVLLDVRVLTAMGPTVSIIATILWIVAITNAFNFLDNMDGLSAGVAIIIASALLGAEVGLGRLFIAAWVCVFMGAMAGFLPYNVHPARTFMGDSGSMVVGFLLAVLTCLATYVPQGQTFYLYGVLVPLVLMALPLYDMVSVVTLRLKQRRNPMIGDQSHFAHRLLRRGMSVRTAVLTIYLCTAATSIAASLMPHVQDNAGALLVIGQTVLILLLLTVLEFGDRTR